MSDRQVWNSCKTTENTCVEGEENCSDCYTGYNSCEYGCDTRYY